MDIKCFELLRMEYVEVWEEEGAYIAMGERNNIYKAIGERWGI